jgi:hypothetical protein
MEMNTVILGVLEEMSAEPGRPWFGGGLYEKYRKENQIYNFLNWFSKRYYNNKVINPSHTINMLVALTHIYVSGIISALINDGNIKLPIIPTSEEFIYTPGKIEKWWNEEVPSEFQHLKNYMFLKTSNLLKKASKSKKAWNSLQRELYTTKNVEKWRDIFYGL